MCVVSMVFDHGRTQPIEYWNPQTFEDFKRAIEGAKVVDAVTGQPDCEDPKKSEFFARVERRMRALEAAKRLNLGPSEAEAFATGAEWAVSK